MNGKLKNIIDKIKNIYGRAYASYPVTMILVNITTLLAAVFAVIEESRLAYDSPVYYAVEWLFVTFVSWCAGSLAVETACKSTLKKVIGVAVSGLISMTLYTLSSSFILWIDLKQVISIYGYRVTAFYLAYYILIVLFVFYRKYKESNLPIAKYFVSVLTTAIEICIVWGILALGFLLLGAAFETLLFHFAGLFLVPQVLIVGLYVVPFFLMGIGDVKEEISRFFQVLIKYVMLIITLVGAVIIYLYIIKTIITGIPSNEVFAIASALFFVSIPVGFACTAFEKDTTFQKIAFVLPYIYAPFIVLQLYSLIIRVSEYGMTPSRYAGFVLIILEILYTLVYAFARDKIDKLIIVMMAITVIATLIPGINAIDCSRLTQKSVITRFIKNGLPETGEGRGRLLGAYNYLKNEYGNAYIDSILSDDLQAKIEEIKPEQKVNTFKVYNLTTQPEPIPLEGYDYMSEFYAVFSADDDNRDMTAMEMEVDNVKNYDTVDLSDIYETVIDMCKEAGGTDAEGPIIKKISDDCELYVETVCITTDKTATGDIEVTEYSAWGHILMTQEYIDSRK